MTCVPREGDGSPIRIAYADPPYPGKAGYYEGHPDHAGEVDHGALLSRLQRFDVFALSTSAEALPHVLTLCVRRELAVRVASWHRGARPQSKQRRALNAWEPVIYWHAHGMDRDVAPGTLDVLEHVSRPRLTDPDRVIGAKPAAFAFWLFELLGASAGDEFVDLFPGSRGMSRAWSIFCERATHLEEPGSVAVGRGRIRLAAPASKLSRGPRGETVVEDLAPNCRVEQLPKVSVR